MESHLTNSQSGSTADHSDLSAQQKASVLTYHMMVFDCEYTATEVAEMFGMSWRGAYDMLGRMSGVVPIINDAGRWRRFDP